MSVSQEAFPLPPSSPKVLKITEATVLGLLRAKHARTGNGGSGEFAFFAQVRDAGGFEASVTVDAVTVSLWPSRGYEIEGYEVKVSRGDWLRELGKPHKAEAACKVVDRFSIVAPRGVVAEGELPETWGLIEVIAGKEGGVVVPKLRTAKLAPLLASGPTRRRKLSRDFLVGLIRSCPGAIPGGKLDLYDREALHAARADGVEAGRRSAELDIERWKIRAESAEEAIRTFQREAGVTLSGWTDAAALNTVNPRAERLGEVARALKAVLANDDQVRRATDRLTNAARQLREQADALDRAAGLVAKP